MSDLKTQPTGASVARFISAIPDAVRRGDCRTLASIMTRATGAKAEMWGASIVGFGRFHYRYDSGREGDWFLAGFSPRKTDLTVYVMGGLRENAALLAKLGKHRTSGGGCLYVKRLAEIDLAVLETLIARSAATLRAMDAIASKSEKPAKAAPRPAVKPAKAALKPAPKPAKAALTPAKPVTRTKPTARAATTARRAR